LELVVLTLGVLFIAACVAWHAVDVFGARRLASRKRVLVALRSGRAVTGVLWARRGRSLVLKSAEMLEPGQEAIPMDGDVILDRGQVEYVQVAG
jgi:small nuclear ribonucleoprotein (snRNP)-like protein